MPCAKRPSSSPPAPHSIARVCHPQSDERAAHRSRARSLTRSPRAAARRSSAHCALALAHALAARRLLLRSASGTDARHNTPALGALPCRILARRSPALLSARATLLAASTQQPSASHLSPGECRRPHTSPIVEDAHRRATRDVHNTLPPRAARSARAGNWRRASSVSEPIARPATALPPPPWTLTFGRPTHGLAFRLTSTQAHDASGHPTCDFRLPGISVLPGAWRRSARPSAAFLDCAIARLAVESTPRPATTSAALPRQTAR
ncbi:hypothetical protein K491DRAFT_715799 [Lophiostoma macrostomum CBS 122681]|uniref:Uncharacterized protein n=1 Tax=Lophiostoma macrostomum CBS 122681 TaxID=1314788 RepID=A0A6A6TAL9_9PLEO|nr:hypothetical protein K491DRAFT_715799 [Lophiostoma macrostomum CBS 122681]